MDADFVGGAFGGGAASDGMASYDRSARRSAAAIGWGVSGLAPEIPEDFDAFWAETTNEALSSKLEFRRLRAAPVSREGFQIELIDFRSASGEMMHGWLAIPKPRIGKAPCFLWLPAYGRASHLPDEYSTRDGMVSMSFNMLGEDAFHTETYEISRGYFTEGIEDPHTWIFRKLFQDAIMAIRVLRAQIEADEDRLAVAGFSQGGGIAIWCAAHSPHVRAAVADMPFLCGMEATLRKPVYRYPLKEVTDFARTIPLGIERVLYTMSYYDTINQATRVKVPTQVAYGLKDPASRPEHVKAAYDAIPAAKRLVEYPGGHDWDAMMVNANKEWMLERLA